MALHDALEEKDVYIVLKDMAEKKTGYIRLQQIADVFASIAGLGVALAGS